MITMPIRLLTHKGKPYAYQWGNHGFIYLISKHGKKGAIARAEAQARAAHAHGYTETVIDKVSKNFIVNSRGSQYDISYENRDHPQGAPEEYHKMWKTKKLGAYK
jgi:hypothetical protein